MGVLAAAEFFATEAGKDLMSTLWPLLAVTAALTIAFTLFVNKNAEIDKEIKESQIIVKNLENAYKDLDRAVSSAMGDAEIGAKRAAVANKQLQLVELERQLALEKSRSSKKQDKDKIADLEGQIIDLKNSITDTTNSIVTDLLGISSAKDAAESLVQPAYFYHPPNHRIARPHRSNSSPFLIDYISSSAPPQFFSYPCSPLSLEF